MADATATSSGGVGIVGALGIAFVILKLTHTIAWPWLWVLAPFWIGTILAVVLVVVAIIIVVVLAD